MNTSQMKILVVDDSAEDREIFSRYLKQSGQQSFRIIETDSGIDGWELCQKEDPDCILLDYQIPDLDGLEFVSSLAQDRRRRFTPVLMLTGQGDEVVAAEALKNGAWDYLVKNKLTPEGLYRALARAVEKASILRTAEQQRREIERSNKELEQFAYTASHDLQAPVRRIISFLELIQKDVQGDLSDRCKDFLDRAVDNAVHMRRLIQDLLDYSRVGGSEKPFESVNLQDLIRDVLAVLETTIRDTHAQVTVHKLPTISGNPTFLMQLFQNLIGNALKFRREDPPFIEIRARLERSAWHFTVKDNGMGIPAECCENIFGIFQRLDHHSQIEGTGIGLAICKKIVELHGGRIWAESVLHEGTTFHFTLPKADSASQELDEAES